MADCNRLCGWPAVHLLIAIIWVDTELRSTKFGRPAQPTGNRIWYLLDRVTYFGDQNFTFDGLNGTPPFPCGATQFEWDEMDRSSKIARLAVSENEPQLGPIEYAAFWGGGPCANKLTRNRRR